MGSPQETSSSTSSSPRSISLRSWLTDSPLWICLGFLVAGFTSGAGGLLWLINGLNMTIVVKGTCVSVNDIYGVVISDKAVLQIGQLIELGRNYAGKTEDSRIWLMRVVSFIHGLELRKDTEWQGAAVSRIESDVRYALLDPSVDVQRQKVVGILEGFRGAMESRVTPASFGR